MDSKASQPEYNGECAFAVSLGKEDEGGGDPSCTLERDGKTYYFKHPVTRMLFRLIPGSAARAEKAWAERSGT